LNVSDKKISLLYVIDGLEFGGGERVFLQLASNLRDRYRVVAATKTNGTFASELDKLGIELLSVNMSRQLTFAPIRQLRNIIHQNDISLVHSQGARADFFARLAGRTTNASHIICTVAMPVEGFEVGPWRKRIYRLMDQLSERYVDRFVVVSDVLKHTLTVNRSIDAQRVVRIYNGIELDQYRLDFQDTGLRNQWDIPPSVPLIGAIGRLVWQKGFEYFIEAIPRILSIVPEATFLIVGEGPLLDNLEGLARKLGVENKVVFTGFRNDIQNVLATLDILAVPSVLEGFPMITLEAMAMAKPIIASKIQGISEQIFDQKEGILVPPRSPSELAAAVIEIVRDKELALRIGLAARRRVEDCFTVEKMVRETEDLYLSLLAGN
jgi:glycosyltransferase involved in cell wall biosynthesis